MIMILSLVSLAIEHNATQRVYCEIYPFLGFVWMRRQHAMPFLGGNNKRVKLSVPLIEIVYCDVHSTKLSVPLLRMIYCDVCSTKHTLSGVLCKEKNEKCKEYIVTNCQSLLCILFPMYILTANQYYRLLTKR